MDKNSPNYELALELVKQLEELGFKVIISDIADFTSIKYAARKVARMVQARLFVPSNFDFDADWSLVHFDVSALDATIEIGKDSVLVTSDKELKIVAAPSRLNDKIDGLTVEDVTNLLQCEKLLDAGVIRQEKGKRDAVINKIKQALASYWGK